MTDSNFLYELMKRFNEARAKYPNVSMWSLMKQVTDLQKELENNSDKGKLHDKALDVACVALRLSVEVWEDKQ